MFREGEMPPLRATLLPSRVPESCSQSLAAWIVHARHPILDIRAADCQTYHARRNILPGPSARFKAQDSTPTKYNCQPQRTRPPHLKNVHGAGMCRAAAGAGYCMPAAACSGTSVSSSCAGSNSACCIGIDPPGPSASHTSRSNLQMFLRIWRDEWG